MTTHFELRPATCPTAPELLQHIDDATAAVTTLRRHLATIDWWGAEIAHVLSAGGRLLAAGNGGSAAHAQHLTSELVGRFRDDRPPFSAIALHSEGSALTAIVNDFGVDEMFARQVAAHGRAGDLLVLLSTSGASPNLLAATSCGEARGLRTLAITGPGPNPLAERSQQAIVVAAPSMAAVQEAHQVVVHLLCVAFEHHLGPLGPVPVRRQEGAA